MTELLVGTKKGLFVLEGEPGGAFAVRARAFAGEPVEYAMRDPRSGRVLATRHVGLVRPADLARRRPGRGVGAGRGRRAAGGRRRRARADLGDRGRRGRRHAVRRRRPGRAVREPRRRRDVGAAAARSGSTRRRPDWQPGGGGLCLHSIVPWPGDPDRLALAISAVGVWLTDDGGRRGATATTGIVAALPPGGVAAATRSTSASTTCTARRGGRSGCSCSSTAASTAPTTRASPGRTSAPGLPSDFGFPLALDPADPDSAYVIPLQADVDRVTPDGRVRVYETRDAGRDLDAARRRPARPSTPT